MSIRVRVLLTLNFREKRFVERFASVMASHECQICTQQFATVDGLNMHTVRVHGKTAGKATPCVVNVGKYLL